MVAKVPDKLFFSIGEVSKLAGVKPYVLRYWESEFRVLSPEKNKAGQRVYRKKDVELVLRIRNLLYKDLYTIAGAKKKLKEELRARGEQIELELWPDNHYRLLGMVKKGLREILDNLKKH